MQEEIIQPWQEDVQWRTILTYHPLPGLGAASRVSQCLVELADQVQF